MAKRASSGSWVVLCQNPEAKTQFVPYLLFSTLSEPQPTTLNKPSKPQNLSNSIENKRILDSGSSSFSLKTSKTLLGSVHNHTFSRNIFVSGSKPLALSSASGKNITGSHCSPLSSISFGSQRRGIWHLSTENKVLASGCGVLVLPMVKSLYSSRVGLAPCSLGCLFGTQAAMEPSTCDGLTVDRIIASEWLILDEDESDWKSHAAAIAQSIHLIKKRLQWKKLMVRLDLLSAEVNKPDLWNDPVHAGKISREHGSLMGKMKEVKAFERELLEHIDMVKLAREENDGELESESMNALLKMRITSKEKETEALLAGEQDPCSCYIEVQSGAGGTESNDWAAMVMQMYKMWAQQRGYKISVVDEMPGEIAGIKVQINMFLQRATIKVDGEYAFGYAKAEVGVHRLVRISPFDSSKRRHTSFAAVAVTPINEDASAHVQINESDLRIERFRSGDLEASTLIQLIVLSQHMNKASAMAVLQSRLDQLEMARQTQMNAQYSQSLTDITWGSQIRSYVLHPYRMVKDLRTNYEVSDPDSVLEGDLDGFIMSYLSASLDKDEDDR
ncbi:Peptide chain release factor 2 [Prunus dulcis]|uniref:Peptide chain release factor 2 n=1 Tax=Prunus dulcis TaxID=3755 RepID=A0A4Y1RQF8_PRUDU|nr:Peptide chain release factor 2 [Prunus dulcis]